MDYLLKPFDQNRLLAAIERVRRHMADSTNALALRLEALLEPGEAKWPETLVVRTGDRFDFMAVSSVDWIEAVLHCGSVTHHFQEGLTGLESRLDPGKFLRVHRSFIVNVSRIVACHSMPRGVYELELRCGMRPKTGRQYRDRIRDLLGG